MKNAKPVPELTMDKMVAALEAYQKDEARWASAQDRLSQLMRIWGVTFNIMAAFAAPRVLAKLPTERVEMRKQMSGIFEDYVELVTGEKSGEKFIGEDFQRTLEPTRRAVTLLEQWDGGDKTPAPLVQAARDFFVAFGWAEPDCGWEAWEGPPSCAE
jgi:hypothetical protein